MTRFQDSQWAQCLDAEAPPLAPRGGTIGAPGPLGATPAASLASPLAALADPEAEAPGDRRHSRSWFDSSWDLRAGADVAELAEFPPEFRDTLGGGLRLRPTS